MLALCGTLSFIGAAWSQNPPVAQTQGQGQTQAQTQTEPATSAQTQDQTQTQAQPQTLQEVVVTAERRATNLQTTPISISAVSGEQLGELHLNNITSLQNAVPNLQVNEEGDFYDFINIRGVGNGATSPELTTGIAVYRDGVLMSETVGQEFPLFDIQDVEVLKGPQGTFVGASSTGGAININSVDPNFRGVNGYAEAQIGNYSDRKIDGAVNLPWNDTFAARLSFNDEQRGSFYKDIGALEGPEQPQPFLDPGQVDDKDARVSLLWKPVSSFQALLKIEYDTANTEGTPGQLDPYTYNSLFTAGSQNTAGVNAGCTEGSSGQLACPVPGTVQHAPYFSNYSGSPFVLNYGNSPASQEFVAQQTRYGLELRDTLPDGIVLRSLSAFVNYHQYVSNWTSEDSANAGYGWADTGPNDNYYSEEINLISPITGPVSWIAGGYWYYRDTPLYITSYAVPAPYLSTTQPTTVTYLGFISVERIGAVFGQLSWQLARTLQLQVGARENWDNNFTDNSNPIGNGVFLIGPPQIRIVSLNEAGHFSDSVPTGKIDLNWTPAPGQFFYAFYARGYKTGGINAGDPVQPTFNPEHVNDYELGWKGQLLNGHMVTQVGGYWMNYQNMQYPIFDIYDVSFGSEVANLAASTLKGIEFSEQSRFGPWGIDLNLAYSHSALGAVTALPSYALPASFNSPIPHNQCGATPTPGCFNYTPYLETVTGEQMPYAPNLSGSGSIEYDIPVGNGTLAPQITYSYVSQQFGSIFQNVTYYLMTARSLWGANLTYRNGPWMVQAFGTNLTNEVYIIGNEIPVFYGPPRQVGLRATRTF